METKYYTPTIDEFHVGFEFESCSYGQNDWTKRVFESDQFDILSKISNSGHSQKVLRVKYLDQEDIESLGWKHDFNDDGEEIPNLRDKHGYSLGFSIDKQSTPLNTAYLLHFFPDKFLIIDSIVNNGSGREEMLFRGYVKNKSELKQVMRMLGIANTDNTTKKIVQ